jgi:hypothetical protein
VDTFLATLRLSNSTSNYNNNSHNSKSAWELADTETIPEVVLPHQVD